MREWTCQARIGLSYVSRSPWLVSLQVPFHDRDHSTIVDGDTEISTSRASGLGDVRVMGRDTLTRAMDRSWSAQFGAKFPTGSFDQNFASGPQAGERLDRGLQPGTGTTDLLAGISYFTRPSVSLGVFGQALLDQPLNSRDSGCCRTPLNHDASDRSERQTHPLRGVIVDVLPGKKSILVKHEAIPGFMPAMTMLFRVDGATLAGLKKGQTITATLVTDEDGMMLTDVKVVAPSS